MIKKGELSYSKQGREELNATYFKYIFTFYSHTYSVSSFHSHQITTCDFRALLAGAVRRRVRYRSAVYGGRVLHHAAT